MKRKLIFLLSIAFLLPLAAAGQKVEPQAYYVDTNGDEKVSNSISDAQAPFSVTLRANPKAMDEWTPSYEWHFRKTDAAGGYEEFLVRYEEDTQYTFVESGTFHVVLKTMLNRGSDTSELDSVTIDITISESFLEMPNAFSPNDDGFNDIYGAKGVCDKSSTAHYKSIVEFHAYIFNRWGQKLYDWTEVSKGWDGTFNGKPVKDGVYFVLVKAKGADGKQYNIRRDVNLLRGRNESDGNSSSNTP